MSEEKNYAIRLRLKQLKQTLVTNINGKEGKPVPVVIIPIEPNGIFVGEKDCYLDLSAYALKNPSYGQTHLIKRSLSSAERESMSEEDVTNMPIIGNMKEIKKKEQPSGSVDGNLPVDLPVDDLPF